MSVYLYYCAPFYMERIVINYLEVCCSKWKRYSFEFPLGNKLIAEECSVDKTRGTPGCFSARNGDMCPTDFTLC